SLQAVKANLYLGDWKGDQQFKVILGYTSGPFRSLMTLILQRQVRADRESLSPSPRAGFTHQGSFFTYTSLQPSYVDTPRGDFCTCDCSIGKQPQYCLAGGICGKHSKDRPRRCLENNCEYPASAHFKQDFGAIGAC
ncbi:hypothetical protein STEG23_008245, partial [Scotinomys teguina]